MKIKRSIIVIALLLLVVGVFMPNLGFAQDIHTASGKLKGLSYTGNGPDANGRKEVKVALEINGVTIYYDMWMTPNQKNKLSRAIGKKIRIKYYWDGEGHRIYIGFSYDFLLIPKIVP